MYSTCLFCHASLGANEVIEHFPVGRRLAFDAAKGRLWVVCRRCGRWNLSPLEERWEAIEECEERFRSTRLRVSTDNIGLCHLKEGLELVRIGEPLRPELAAWRYGERFGKRRTKMLIRASLGLGAITAIVVGGAAAGVGVGGFGWMYWQLSRAIVRGNPRAVIARIDLEDRQRVEVKRKHLAGLSLHPDVGDRGWTMRLTHAAGVASLTGDAALRAAAQLMPAVNHMGGTRAKVTEAVGLLEHADSPAAYFGQAVRFSRDTLDPAVKNLPDSVRLALEMAAHEEAERRALEGELARLEADWKEAEEIAAIADNLLVPAGFDDLLRRFRKS
ncbi:MAG: hypothetical protein ACREON_18695 [Gemmatimonadaceae bacterium]